MSSNGKIDKFEEHCSNRANIYKLFADCFRYPEPQLDQSFRSLSEELLIYDPSLKSVTEKLVACLKTYNSELNELQVEYSRLFIGPFHLYAAPYSSIYLDKQVLVMGESTQQAIDFYVKAGLDPSDENKEPPDHISTELEFMYFLLFQKVVKKEDDSFKMSISFLEKHLCHWVPLFTKRIMESSENIVYLELSKLLDAFIQKEIELYVRGN